MEQQPSVGRIVHFVQEGVESPAAHRAAVVTEVYESGITLAVFKRMGLGALVMGGPCVEQFEGVQYDPEMRPNTWHWPERV